MQSCLQYIENYTQSLMLTDCIYLEKMEKDGFFVTIVGGFQTLAIVMGTLIVAVAEVKL